MLSKYLILDTSRDMVLDQLLMAHLLPVAFNDGDQLTLIMLYAKCSSLITLSAMPCPERVWYQDVWHE